VADDGGAVVFDPFGDVGGVVLGEGGEVLVCLGVVFEVGDLVGEGFDVFFDGGDEFAGFGGGV